MKKAFVFAAAAFMILNLGACREKKAKEEAVTGSLSPFVIAAGDWTREESPEITEEAGALLEKATSAIVGNKYTPVAYLGSQKAYFEGQKEEDAGIIHALLCRKAIVPPAPAEKEIYVILYIHESLEGNAVITDIENSEVTTNISELPAGTVMGGWNQAKSPVITEKVKDVFGKAVEGLAGVDYSPVALLATQVVSGTNYCILCEYTPRDSDAETDFALVFIHELPDGSAELLDTALFIENV